MKKNLVAVKNNTCAAPLTAEQKLARKEERRARARANKALARKIAEQKRDKIARAAKRAAALAAEKLERRNKSEAQLTKVLEERKMAEAKRTKEQKSWAKAVQAVFGAPFGRYARTLDLQFFAGAGMDTDNSGSADTNNKEVSIMDAKKAREIFNRIYLGKKKDWLRSDIYSARKSYLVNVIEIKKLSGGGWTALQRTQTMYESEFTRAYAKVKELNKGDLIQDLLLVNFPGDKFDEVELMLNAYKSGNKFYYATEDKSAELRSVFDEASEQVIYNCFTDKIAVPQLENMMTLNKVGSSPSSFRGKTMMYVEPSSNMEEIINLASHGAYFKMKAKGEVFTWAQRQKMEVRIWQCLSPSTAVDTVNTVAIYGGKEGKGYVEDSLAIFQVEEELAGIVDIAARKVLDQKAFEKFVNKHKLAITVCDTISCADIDELLKTSELCQLKGTSDGVLHSNRNDMIYKKNWSNVVGSMQGRPASAKAMVVATTQRSIDSKVTALDENPIRILRKDMTIQQEEWLDDLLFGMAKEDNPYKGRVVIICDNLDASVELLGDLNAYKCAWDYKMATVMPCLDAPKVAKASLSKQAANKLFGLNAKEAYGLIKDLLEENIQGLIDRFYDTKVTGFKELKNLYAAGIITSAYKDALKVDPALKRSVVQTLLNQISNVLNDFKVEIKESATQRAIADPAGLYGFRVLSDTEMYSVDVPNGVKVLLLKYPTAAPREGMIFTSVGLQEIIARIKKLDTTDEIKNALIDDYRCIESGCGVVSACKRNMKLLAGMDYDWDQFMAIWLKTIVNFLINNNFKPEMVDINPGKAKDSGKRYAINLDTLGLAQVKDIRSDEENVGGCTVKGDTFIQMNSTYEYYEGNEKAQNALIDLMSNTFDCAYALNAKDESDISYANRDAAIEWAKSRIAVEVPEYKNIGVAKAPSIVKATGLNKPIALTSRDGAFVGFNTDETNKYSRVFIDGALKEKVRYSLKTCRITKNNMKAISRALEQVLHHDQEIIIDSPKTSITTDAMCNSTTVVKCFGRKRYAYEITNNQIVRKSMKLGKIYNFMDLFAKIRDEVEFKMIPKAQAILDAQEDMTHEIMSEIGSILGAATNNEGEKEKIKTGLYLSQLYGAAYKELASLPRETEREQAYYACRKEAVQKYCKAIYAMFRTLMNDAGTLERAKYAYLFSAYRTTEDGAIVQKNNKNSFDTSIAEKEMIFFYAKMFGGLALVGSKVAIASEGIKKTRVSAKNGRIFDKDGNYVGVLADNITKDQLAVIERNGNLYACDDLASYLEFEYDNSLAAVMLPVETAENLVVGKTYNKSDFDLVKPVARLVKGTKIEIVDISVSYKEIEMVDAFGAVYVELVKNKNACVLFKVAGTDTQEENQEEVQEENQFGCNTEQAEDFETMDQDFCDSLVRSFYVEESEQVYVSNLPIF